MCCWINHTSGNTQSESIGISFRLCEANTFDILDFVANTQAFPVDFFGFLWFNEKISMKMSKTANPSGNCPNGIVFGKKCIPWSIHSSIFLPKRLPDCSLTVKTLSIYSFVCSFKNEWLETELFFWLECIKTSFIMPSKLSTIRIPKMTNLISAKFKFRLKFPSSVSSVDIPALVPFNWSWLYHSHTVAVAYFCA